MYNIVLVDSNNFPIYNDLVTCDMFPTREICIGHFNYILGANFTFELYLTFIITKVD